MCRLFFFMGQNIFHSTKYFLKLIAVFRDFIRSTHILGKSDFRTYRMNFARTTTTITAERASEWPWLFWLCKEKIIVVSNSHFIDSIIEFVCCSCCSGNPISANRSASARVLNDLKRASLKGFSFASKSDLFSNTKSSGSYHDDGGRIKIIFLWDLSDFDFSRNFQGRCDAAVAIEARSTYGSRAHRRLTVNKSRNIPWLVWNFMTFLSAAKFLACFDLNFCCWQPIESIERTDSDLTVEFESGKVVENFKAVGFQHKIIQLHKSILRHLEKKMEWDPERSNENRLLTCTHAWMIFFK